MLKRLKFVIEQWVLFMVRRQTWQARWFEICDSARHFRIELNRDVRFEFESGSFADPYQKATYAACKPLTFGPSCRNPLAKVDGSMPEYAQVCALHTRPQSTALGDAKENRNGRRLSCYRRKPQNWYYVTYFLAHPVEPRDRWVQTHATVG